MEGQYYGPYSQDYYSTSQGSDNFSNGWWDQNGDSVVTGASNVLSSLFTALPGIIATSNGQQPTGPQQPFTFGNNQPQPQPQQQQQNTTLYIIVIVVILLLVMGGLYFFTRKSA